MRRVKVMVGNIICQCSAFKIKQKKLNELLRRRRRAAFRQKLRTVSLKFVEHMQQNYANVGLYIFGNRRPRKIWSKERSSEWWKHVVQKKFDKNDWKENFRMEKSTFDFLCQRLYPHLKHKDNYVRTPLSVETKVAVSIYKLASCCEYRVVGNQFGLHKSTVQKCVYAFCEAVIKELLPEFVHLPNEFEAIEISKEFEKMSGIPNIIGAIDGTHVPILPPSEGYRDFVNRKGWPSYNVQAVVDHKYRFRDITCKHPGSSHDALVLRDSFLFRNADRVLPKNGKEVGLISMPYFLIGDPAYPLLPWLMKGYKHVQGITAEEESFNVYLSKGRIVVENAFGRLKARWRCLLKRNDLDYVFVPKLVATCVVLHNLVETRKDQFIPAWMNGVEEAENLYPQPAIGPIINFDNFNGAVIRNHLKDYIGSHFPLLRSKIT